MKTFSNYLLLISFCILFSCGKQADNELLVDGLLSSVEVIRDQWGINHIYAENQHDLFLAQGYCAAKDRLFQFEVWRRQATGTVAEILGEREVKRDHGTRLFKFRGDMKTEMDYYHQDGEEIITAYVDGVNAYIDEVMQNPDSLPLEFRLLGIQPQKWTPEVVISRHQGLLGNIGQELSLGRAVAKAGVEKVKELSWFHPKDPLLDLDPAINGDLLFDDILGLYNAYRRGVQFESSDIIIASKNKKNNQQLAELLNQNYYVENEAIDWTSIGSNNWVVNGNLTESGNTVMANDPHRRIAAPSLRYMAHLVAPGWNVIGGGEPEIPGISIGHNEYGAWGLTVFRTDGEDLYVYDLNPDNLNQYKYQDSWEDMNVIQEIIKVKDSDDVELSLRYTRHGPVTFIDSANYKAYAVRCAWMEPGGSPYLASLRMDQAQTWEEFREACNYSHIPGENMVWADKEGNIGWQAVGIAPIRRNFSGMVPVPGDGRYEWDNYLEIKEKPNVTNPEAGFFSTANQNVTPESYQHWDAVGFSWSDPFRGDRVNEVLASGEKLTMQDMKALQTDYLSIPARVLVPLLDAITFDTGKSSQAKEKLMNWDYILNKNSVEAGIYIAWESQIRRNAIDQFLPEELRGLIFLQFTKVINWITQPGSKFGSDSDRNNFLKESFDQAVGSLVEKFGDNMDNWQYGQENYKHVYIRHALSEAVDDEMKATLNVGPLPRGGNSYTPGSTGSGNNQTSGASFRIIVDTGDWDSAVGTNPPGQSGDPESPFYNNLFDSWVNDEYFPVYYSREKVESVKAESILLKPVN